MACLALADDGIVQGGRHDPSWRHATFRLVASLVQEEWSWRGQLRQIVSWTNTKGCIMHSAITVLKDDPCIDWGGGAMEFRLTYEGPLRTSGNANHKHEIRRTIHPQLKRLWSITSHLKDMVDPLPTSPFSGEGTTPRAAALAKRFARNQYHFVPLVTRDLKLLCGLEILFLRPDAPGSLIHSGDIDNRLKTLFDALRMPRDASELGDFQMPSPDEDPFYCLLEDDCLITKISVQTDILLQPTGAMPQPDPSDARLVITVILRPHEGSWGNIDFL
jgi:hypothetical protein